LNEFGERRKTEMKTTFQMGTKINVGEDRKIATIINGAVVQTEKGVFQIFLLYKLDSPSEDWTDFGWVHPESPTENFVFVRDEADGKKYLQELFSLGCIFFM
jgi:hypothetical protein